MALTQRLELKQGQSLVMTPQLQQAIKLLQLSNLDLSDYVEAEVEKNPLLEHENVLTEEPTMEPREPEAGPEAMRDAPVDEILAGGGFAAAADLDAGRDDLYTDERVDAKQETAEMPAMLTDWSRAGTGGRAEGNEDLEERLSSQSTLKGHLEAQLAIAALSPDRRFIAEVLIESVDESGYLRADLTEIAARLGASPGDCEATLGILQGFDPCGVFARDLPECLALQLKERDRLDPAMQILLTRLDLAAKRDYSALSALCALEPSEIIEAIAEIRALNPKPGLAFGCDPVQPVVPDIHVRKGPGGTWQIEVNSETLPRVLVNTRYYAEVSRTARSREDKIYLTDCLNSANWLVKSLDQRARTMLKVAREIVRQQDAFLMYGVRRLRPLNLRAIADAIGMHESTISRVTSNKYVETPRGVFELKYFFTPAIQSVNGGQAYSAEAVRDRIRELVEKEADDILSDDRIVTMLSADGIDIARRTVAKYREALRILSSVERRKLRQSEIPAAAQ
jgi:RNA polymerase sigma-54 factor